MVRCTHKGIADTILSGDNLDLHLFCQSAVREGNCASMVLKVLVVALKKIAIISAIQTDLKAFLAFMSHPLVESKEIMENYPPISPKVTVCEDPNLLFIIGSYLLEEEIALASMSNKYVEFTRSWLWKGLNDPPTAPKRGFFGTFLNSTNEEANDREQQNSCSIM